MAEQMMGRNGGTRRRRRSRRPRGPGPGAARSVRPARRDENGNGGVDDGGLMRMGKAPNDYALEKAQGDPRGAAPPRRRALPPRDRARLHRPAAEAVLSRRASLVALITASVSSTAAQISASVKGLAMMRWASASRLWARWRSLGIAAHQQDLHRRIILARLERERDAVEPGHDDVAEQQIERARRASAATAASPSGTRATS